MPSALANVGRGGVFFLHGDDEFRKEEAARALVDAHVDPATRDFNYDLLRGSELDLESLARILATPPMMAEWRVVLVREAEALAQSSRARDVITDLLDAPPPGLALILVTTIPDRSKARFYKDLKRDAKAVEFGQVSGNDLPGWVMERARSAHGVEVEEEAARALAAAVGSDLGILAREIEKLASMVDEGQPITVKEVKAGGTTLPTQDRWQWFDLVGERRFGEALEGLRILLDQGESGVGLVIGLGTHLLRLGIAVEQGPRGLEQALPPHQRWLARRYGQQAGGWSDVEVEEALLGLLRADQLLKASGFPDEHLLEEWLLERTVRAREAA